MAFGDLHAQAGRASSARKLPSTSSPSPSYPLLPLLHRNRVSRPLPSPARSARSRSWTVSSGHSSGSTTRSAGSRSRPRPTWVAYLRQSTALPDSCSRVLSPPCSQRVEFQAKRAAIAAAKADLAAKNEETMANRQFFKEELKVQE